MRCPGKDTHDEESACPDCDGDGEVECCECGHYRECRECDGTGQRTVTMSGHLVPCEICENGEDVPEFVADWITAKQLAAISRDAQRGIITLHNRGELVYPPRVVDYGLTVFCVERKHPFKRTAAEVAKVVPGAKLISPDGLANLPSWLVGAVLGHDGLWCLLDATPPTYAEVLAFVREAKQLTHAAA